MSISPVQFAKEFARLKSDLAAQSAPDERLLLIIEFWGILSQKARQDSYRSYVEEYFELLTPLAKLSVLIDLTRDELIAIRAALNDMAECDGDDIHNFRTLVIQRLCALDFYVGDISSGIDLCADYLNADPIDIPDEIIQGKTEYDAIYAACDYIKDRRQQLHQFIRPIMSEWESYREAYYHDRIACLFVDKDNRGASGRGRMRVLEGSIELSGKAAASDEVSFDNQVKSPDDPFVGVTYDALAAVRRHFLSLDDKSRCKTFYHAHYAVRDSGQTFTGDSIGLASALVAYTELLHPDIVRSERFLSAEVACTGSIDADGNINGINPDTLHAKIARAFFSPMKYVVVPKSNLTQAQEYVDSLRERYPRRRLQLIGVDHLRDAIDNRNILRDEKVCIGEYVGRKAAKVSRSVKVQVPILLALLYIMLSIIYPKAWLFFDWNPEYVKVGTSDAEFIVLNSDSTPLWSIQYNCEIIDSGIYTLTDLNDDGLNDILFIPSAAKNSPCSLATHLFAYDSDGTFLFKRPLTIYKGSDGDTLDCSMYKPGRIDVFNIDDSLIIVTRAYESYPARQHVRLWNARGDSLGWYINSGWGGGLVNGKCIALDERGQIIYAAINNRFENGAACLFVLNPYSSQGVSPPFSKKADDSGGFIPGKQSHYIIFPRTDVNRITRTEYNSPMEIEIESENRIILGVSEAHRGSRSSQVHYIFDKDFRIIDVRLDDRFRMIRDSLIEYKYLPAISEIEYYTNLKNSIIYWHNDTWISEAALRQLENR